MEFVWIFIAIAILASLIVTLLIIKKKSPKAFNSIIIWMTDSLPEYILDVLSFIAVGLIMYVWFKMIM